MANLVFYAIIKKKGIAKESAIPKSRRNEVDYMGKKMGRPRKEIPVKEFEKLCELQCTLIEIASFFDVNVDTITDWCKRTYGMTFSEVFKLKRGKGKVSLRRSQFELAKKNPTMAIWLGKQWLGQTDKMEVEGRFNLSNDEIKKIEEMWDEE